MAVKAPMRGRNALASVDVPFKGGVHREDFNWAQGDGFYTCSGAHGNNQGALTKWTGLDLYAALPVSARIDGLVEVKLAGITYYVSMASGNIYKIEGAAFITLLSTGNTPASYDVRVLQNLAFLISGSNANKKFDGTRVTGMGIAAPTVAATPVVGIAGALTGTYSYKYTFRNSLTDVESDPSPVSANIVPAAQRIELSALAVSTDPQVDVKKIYRTVAGGSIWLFVTEILNATTVYSDNTLDAALGEQLAEDNGFPPQASYLEVFNGMVLLTGLASPNQSRVAVSGVLRPESFDVDNIYDLDPEETDIITGIKKLGQFVGVGKRNGFFVGEGTAPDQMLFTRTRVVDGPVGNWTIIPYEANLFWLSEKGPQVFTGLAETYLGRPIEAIYRTLDITALQTATGIYYKALNMLIWNITTGGVGTSDQWLVFNLLTKEWTFRTGTAARFSTYKDTLGRTRMWVGDYTGKIYTGDVGNSDYGAAIALEVVTRPIAFGKDYDSVHSFRSIESHYEPNGGVAAVTVSYCVDTPAGPFITAGTFLPTTGYRSKINLPDTVVGRRLFVRYYVSSTEALTLYPPTIEGQTLHGRR